MKPYLVVESMNRFREIVLNLMGRLLGLKGEAKIVYIAFEDDSVPTINDLNKMHEENEMNKQTEKETGE